jgi:hypothetical protein
MARLLPAFPERRTSGAGFACDAVPFAPIVVSTLRWRARGAGMPRGSPIRGGACQARTSHIQGMLGRLRRLPTTTSPSAPPASVRFRTASGGIAAALCRPDAPSFCIQRPHGPAPGAAGIGGERTEFTGAVRASALCPQTQGPELSAAPPLQTARTDAEWRDPSRRARTARAPTEADEPAATAARPMAIILPGLVFPGLRSGSPPSPDPRPAPRNRGRPAYRSSGPNDETHADRRHPRGRNPRGGAGR